MSHAAPATATAPLRIGYLTDGSDFVPADDPFGGDALSHRLSDAILSSKNLVSAMERAGFSGVEMIPISSSGEMLQLMRTGNLHLVLCTAIIYGYFRQSAGETQTPFDYEPMLQSRRRGDFDYGHGNGILRRGVVIVGPSSPLFTKQPLKEPELARAIANSPLAVVSIDSAAGYLFPLLTLSAPPYNVSRPGQTWFCGSDTDAVSHVVSGLAPFGACREGALAATLGSIAKANHTTDTLSRYCRIVLKTAPFPTDPILIRGDLLPSRVPATLLSDVGRELKPVLREFFNTQTLDRDLRVEDAVPRAYESVQRALDQWARIGATQRPSAAGPRPTLPEVR
ncbi:phosphate/phosphite/phosphonate ABC transporter substrate-binding protein [bacterium]|nr:phosphate/phosphite/phosphonate ABC transporter substrate-binding protein [bacterium]